MNENPVRFWEETYLVSYSNASENPTISGQIRIPTTYCKTLKKWRIHALYTAAFSVIHLSLSIPFRSWGLSHRSCRKESFNDGASTSVGRQITLRQANIAGWKMDHLKMYFLLNMGKFSVCHVSLPKGKWSPYDFTSFCGSSAWISIAFSSTSPAKVSCNPFHSKHIVLLQLEQHAKPSSCFPWACSSWSKPLFIFLFTRNHYLCWSTLLYCAISTSPSITYCWCLAAWNLAGSPPQLTMPLCTGKSTCRFSPPNTANYCSIGSNNDTNTDTISCPCCFTSSTALGIGWQVLRSVGNHQIKLARHQRWTSSCQILAEIVACPKMGRYVQCFRISELFQPFIDIFNILWCDSWRKSTFSLNKNNL